MSSDREFMLLALAEARKAFDAGEVPIGAVAVRDGEVVASACNQVEAINSVTGHAEIALLRKLEALYHDWRISEVTVYVTKEPCPMCAGMLLNSRVKRLVFGVGDPGCGGCGGAFDVNALPGALWHFEITGNVCGDEAKELLQTFFRKRRKEAQADKHKG